MARPEAVGWRSLVPVHGGYFGTKTKRRATQNNVGRGAEAWCRQIGKWWWTTMDRAQGCLGTRRRAVRQTGRRRDWSEELRGTVCSELRFRLFWRWGFAP